MSKNLINLSTEERVFALSKIAEESAISAEKKLCDLAVAKGDNAVVEVLKRSSPLVIARICTNHDSSSPTIVTWLAEPTKIAEMLAMEPSFWEKSLDSDDIIRIQDEALHLLLSLLFDKKEERQREVIEAIAENEASFFYLLLPFIGSDKMEEITLDMEEDEEEDSYQLTPDLPFEKTPMAVDGSPQQLLEMIRAVCPEVVEIIENALSSSEESSWEKLKSQVFSLRDEALSRLKGESKKADNMFQPL